MYPPLWISGLHNISQLTVRDLQPVPQEDLPILAPDHVRVDIPDEIDDGGLEIGLAIYDTDDDDDDEEDVQKVVNDNDSEGNDLNWEDIDSFDDGIVFDDDDFEDEETAVERMERELRGDEIKEKADLMARQLLRIVEELNDVKTYPSTHCYLSELLHMGIDKKNILILICPNTSIITNNQRTQPFTRKTCPYHHFNLCTLNGVLNILPIEPFSRWTDDPLTTQINSNPDT